ncbi:ATP-binding protein [Streptococcus uberis]|uniref:ATP-binding protein n=1 Tax=Streptococcus uberis TaxID=1349 RepID=UPI0012B50AFA|nr:AAA family ATPase [Streptococcus uberis]MTB36805.1 AAA family ATPase [Streptococcus uberis]MTB57787.1 AAA family ATPase [Streptococcus uberis]
MINYKPIPIYDDIYWDYTSEGCHSLLIAPSGAGKTIFLSYLSAMILKRGHQLFIVDAKNTSFGKQFQSSGVRMASTPVEIINLLTDLVQEMEYDYKTIFSNEKNNIDDNFKTLKIPAKILIFDEVLSALESGDKKQKVEMERLLKLLALKGRMAGYIIVLTSQRLLATDLSKAITEQCQTRYIMGANVSEELFHLATGSYKKNLGTSYNGGVGKGYIISPTCDLRYFEAPYFQINFNDFRMLLHQFLHRGSY